jgi:hypothetical protein
MKELRKHILTNIHINISTGCWEWLGNQYAGYGRLSYNKSEQYTHRLSYEAFVGVIPPHTQILHSCDNPICCSPKHLRIGTNYDNVCDRQSRSRQAKGITHGNHKLTEPEIILIRSKYSTGQYTQQILADEFNCSRSHISNIVNHKFWKHTIT